jgi:tetratricopeptide (TPR) repeat protein
MVPYQRNVHFSGRDNLLQTLEQELKREESGRENHRVALYGMGGIGKTQTALEYVYSRRDSGLYTRIYWLAAKDQASLLADYRRVAGNAGIEIGAGLEPTQIAEAALCWLRKEDEWLVILDNLDDVSVADGLLPDPGLRKHILITTRNPNTEGIPAEGLEVSLLSPDDSQRLLITLSKVKPSATEQDLISTIVEDLGRLPLAIEQAASYIKQITRSFAAFHEQYQKNHHDVLDWIPKGNRPYPRSVATTWSMSFDALNSEFPLSATLLKLFAFLNPDGIRFSFLTQGALSFDSNDLQKVLSTSIEFRKAILELEQLSLVKCNPTDDTITIHRLVQTIIRDSMSGVELAAYCKRIVNLCYSTFPDPNPRTIQVLDQCRGLRGQVVGPIQVVTSSIRLTIPLTNSEESWERNSDSTKKAQTTEWMVQYFQVVRRIETFLGYEGSFRDREALVQRVLEIEVVILGQDHPDTLTSLDDLAETYHDLGKLSEAAEMHEQVLEKRKKVLGEDHPDTLTSMDNVAELYGRLGRLDEAAEIEGQALQKSRKSRGEDHPDTLTSMNNMAMTFRELGKLREATEMEEQVLVKSRKILGEGHPITLSVLSNLGLMYEDVGRLHEAAEMIKQVLKKRREILGEDHPNTILSMNNLALNYRDLGRLDEAAELEKQVWVKWSKILGEDHPYTLTSRNNLGMMYGDLGRVDDAVEMLGLVLGQRRKILGENHQDTLTAMNNLALMYERLGRVDGVDGAAQMLELVLEKRREILGEDHPTTIAAMSNVAYMYGDLGKLDKAVEMDEQILEKRRKISGQDHPETLRAMANLGWIYGRVGRLNESVEMLGDVLERRKRVLGENHPDTIRTANTLRETREEIQKESTSNAST